MNTNIPDGLEIWTDKIRCCDCGRWIYVDDISSEAIRHSSRCDTADLQVAAVEPAVTTSRPSLRTAAKRGEVYRHYSEKDVVDVVRGGRLSVSDAMNQDF